MSILISPHGGVLKDLYLNAIDIDAAKLSAKNYLSWDLTERQLCDIELLLNGAFSPLEGFMNQADYKTVLDSMHLADGTLWTMPITLDVTEKFAQQLSLGDSINLRDQEGLIIAVLDISDLWTPDRLNEAKQVFGTIDEKHPAVDYLFNKSGKVYLGGKLKGLQSPQHYDFKDLRQSPKSLRALFEKNGWYKMVAFQTRNPMHRAHQQITLKAAEQIDAGLLIHPVVGLTKPGDVDHFSRVRCYQQLLPEYPKDSTCLSLLPLAMRMAGPREAVWHAIIRKNYGCSHFIVGRDHAGPGKDSNGNDFYGAYDAQELMEHFQDELGIKMVPFQMMVYVEETRSYETLDNLKAGQSTLNISGTQLREMLAKGEEIPEWFSYPSVVKELRKSYPEKSRQGLTIFFTGLSGAGKSTIANALVLRLMEIGGRSISLLDGDIVRKNLSSELGFSKEHRDLNITRIGYVASEITKHGGFAICAPIAPYADVRQRVREMVQEEGGFVEVYISTSLEECERRDTKGLYAKARAGLIKQFTGIDDPYEEPEQAELVIDTVNSTVEEEVEKIVLKLKELGYVDYTK